MVILCHTRLISSTIRRRFGKDSESIRDDILVSYFLSNLLLGERAGHVNDTMAAVETLYSLAKDDAGSGALLPDWKASLEALKKIAKSSHHPNTAELAVEKIKLVILLIEENVISKIFGWITLVDRARR
jgi:hypothetical protein